LTIAHLHPEIAANDDWKDFVQQRVEETKTTGTISRVKSISGVTFQRRLSRSKSILSRQIDASDEDSWSTYSDAGHKELERRATRDNGQPTERHMITVAELEKLEALIKDGALERQGRPVSSDGTELSEITLSLTADVAPPTEPLMPIKGTLKRSTHTSMRTARRGRVRRLSEPKQFSTRLSQESISDEDALARPNEPKPILQSSLTHGRSESAPLLNTIENDDQEKHLTTYAEKSKTDAAAVLQEQGNLHKVARTTPDITVSPEHIIENEGAVLGQVKPRQLRRPVLRRQTVDSSEILSQTRSPSPSPTKEQAPEKQKKSPVSPSFPPPTSPSPPPPTEPAPQVQEDQASQPSTQRPEQTQPPSLPGPSGLESPSTTIQSKKGAWSRLFTSSSDDEQSKEKPTGKGKPKKSPSYSDIQKALDLRAEEQTSETKRRKSSETSPSPAASPAPPATLATASSPKQSAKKESGIFASLFGSKKKSEPKEKQLKNQESSTTTSAKPATLDRSHYQRYGPGGWGDPGGELEAPALNFYYTRFPIHVERAIYRLSHIKLANPRRPLLQQVLLSNFMYGYLNLINKAAQPQQQQQQAPDIPQQQVAQEAFVETAQPEDHVFYSAEDQSDYYGQDYYGAEYEDDQDDVRVVTYSKLILVCSSRP
jgi:hypothetical protein